MAPKGEKLAYINNRAAELLKRMGVQVIMLLLVQIQD
jgi:hypothetical protein